MNKKFKVGLLVILIFLQIVVHRYMNILRFNVDLLYLILVYISVKSGFFKTILFATVIGLITDYSSMNVMGVFGFSRTITAFLLNEVSIHIDLKNNLFVFLLVALSLFLSNIAANIFFYFILNIGFNLNLIFYQPLFTGLIGVLILSSSRIKKYLDVY